MTYLEWFRKTRPPFLPPQDCPSIFPPKPPVPKPQIFLATDEICGNFNIPCGSSNFTVWNTNEVIPSGTLSVFYSDGCSANLFVSVTNSFGITDMFEVPSLTTISRTYSDLTMVNLACPVSIGNNICTGKYCLTIHYPIEFK